MLDAVLFERAMVPAVPIVTLPFVPTAKAMANLHGINDLAIVAIDHPISSLDNIELSMRARAAAPAVAAALLESG